MSKTLRITDDYYPTDHRLTWILQDRVSIQGVVVEPCAGHGFISSHFEGCITNEPYPKLDFTPDMTYDATSPLFWDRIKSQGGCDWVITNPPYKESLPIKILAPAFDAARIGVAFLLRMSFLEPCRDRGTWLKAHAHQLSNLIIFNPRPSFREDRKSSDSVTVAWFVWQHANQTGCTVHFIDQWK